MIDRLNGGRRKYIDRIAGLVLLILAATVTAFPQTAKKPGIGILIDNTGSFRLQLPRAVEIAKEIVNRLDGNSSVSVFMFAPVPGQEVTVATTGIACTSDKASILPFFDGIRIEGGQTLLFGSISMIGTRMGPERPAKCPEYSERKLILITDGEDRVSKITASELAKELKANGTIVYAVGLVDELSSDGGLIAKSVKSVAKESLTSITNETGGKVVFPKKKQTASEIAAELLGTNPKVSK